MERKTHTAILMTLVMVSAVLAGCLGGSDDDDGISATIIDIQNATTSECSDGGVAVLVGIDANNDSSLAGDEIDSRTVICNGADGSDGSNGADGSDGSDGADGQDGADGADGADGQDGADGAGGGVSEVGAAHYDSGVDGLGAMTYRHDGA